MKKDSKWMWVWGLCWVVGLYRYWRWDKNALVILWVGDDAYYLAVIPVALGLLFVVWNDRVFVPKLLGRGRVLSYAMVFMGMSLIFGIFVWWVFWDIARFFGHDIYYLHLLFFRASNIFIFLIWLLITTLVRIRYYDFGEGKTGREGGELISFGSGIPYKFLNKKWLYNGLFWIGIWVLLILLYDRTLFFNWERPQNNLYFFVAFGITIIVSIVNTQILIPKFLLKKQYRLYGWSLFLLTFLFCLSILTVCQEGIMRMAKVKKIEVFIYDEQLIAVNFIGYLLLLATAPVLKITRHNAREAARKEQLERERLEMELQFLKAQLNPHFFMNTLNTLYGMALQGSEQTPDAIFRLSDLMRYLLDGTKTGELALLSKELKFIQSYLKLMEFRLAGKGRFEFEIEGKAGHQQIVPLLFVSFIENSIEHGLVSTSKEGYVKGRIRIEPNMLEFYLENNYDPDWAGRPQPFKTGAGLGLKNIRRQLALHYPEWRHGLEIEDEGGVFVVRLWVRF